jgi:hypothetical protein
VLQLYFGQFADPDDVAALARAQFEMHRDRIAQQLTPMLERLRTRADRPWQLALAELVAEMEKTLAAQWERIEQAAREGSRRAGSG